MDTGRPRRRFSFSLRALLVLVLVFGLWLGRQVHLAREQRLSVQAIRDYGGFVHYDFELTNDTLTPGKEPWVPAWIRGLIGEDYFRTVVWVSLVYDNSTGTKYVTQRTDDSVLVHLRGLHGLRELLLHKGQATDAGLANLRGLSRLESLYLWDAAELTDAGVAHLKGLRNLKHLHASGTKMTDIGLGHLAGLPRLENFDLQGGRFTNAGLKHLRGREFTRALYLGLGGAEITDEGLAQLEDTRGLKSLDIRGTRVTDRGLAILARVPALEEVWIGDCPGISDEGIQKLKAARPGLRVVK
jgi:internalin A